jgi:hypothetical protein
MNSVAELHTFLRDFDAQHSNCPVARRTAEIRETKERERQAARAVQRQREEQRQQTAANNSITWEAIEERIYDRSRELSRELVALVGDCIGKTRNEDNDHVRRVYDKLREEFRVGMERVPIAKAWTTDDPVCYRGSVVTYGGETFQALQDTARLPAADSLHWIRLARRGQDAITPRICGVYDAQTAYARLDICEHDGGSYIADRDLAPGNIPGIDDGWQPLARRGSRGPVGETGPRGQRGARGQKGENAPSIVACTLDTKNYRAVPTMSNGTQGCVLELYGLFEQFNREAVLPAVDEAVRDAVKS